MSAQLIEMLASVDDLAKMPDDGNQYEVIEGEIFMSRAPDLAHQLIATNIIGSVHPYLKSNPIGTIIATPGLILSPIDGVIPDVVFVTHETRAKSASSGKLTIAPELVIEIVSPGSENARRDRVHKRQLYSRFGVYEYWVIDPEARSVEVFRRQHRALELIEVLDDTAELTTPLFSEWKMKVSELFSF